MGKISNRLTGGVVVHGHRFFIAVVAVVTEQRFIVVILVPVEGLYLEAAPLRMAAHDAGHGLVHVVGRLRAVSGQVEDLCSHVPPALHTRKLSKDEKGWRKNKEFERRH